MLEVQVTDLLGGTIDTSELTLRATVSKGKLHVADQQRLEPDGSGRFSLALPADSAPGALQVRKMHCHEV